jgi:uncharacterized membrane protein
MPQLMATPLWRRMILPLSLVLNFFLIAVIGGHLLQGRRHQDHGLTPLAQMLADAEARLPPKDAATFGTIMRQGAPKYLGAAAQLADARIELGHRITAEPYDKAAVGQALAKWQAQWNQFVDVFSGTLVDALGAISIDSRNKLIKARRAPGLAGAAR